MSHGTAERPYPSGVTSRPTETVYGWPSSAAARPHAAGGRSARAPLPGVEHLADLGDFCTPTGASGPGNATIAAAAVHNARRMVNLDAL